MIKKLLAPLALVLILAACTQPTAVDLQVTALSPEPNATNVPVDMVLSASFNTQVVASSVLGNFELAAEGGELVAGEISYDSATRTATFTPGDDLAYSTVYVASVEGVYTSRGSTLGGSASWSFTTEADPDPGVDPEVVSVTINEGDQTLVVGGGVTLTATVEVLGGASQVVTWSSDDEEVATVNATTGVVLAVGVGEANIIATSAFDASVSNDVTITVVDGEPGPAVLDLSIDPSEMTTLFIGFELDINYEIVVVGDASTTINWTVDGEDGVVSLEGLDEGQTTAEDGVVTVLALQAGTVTIHAISDQDPDFEAFIEITVPVQVVNSVTIDQGEDNVLSVAAGQPVTLTATVDAEGGAPETLEWILDDVNDVATIDVDPETGEVTVSPLAEGAVMVTATSTFAPDVSDFIIIYISEVFSVDIDGDSILYLVEDVTTTLTATVDLEGPGSADVSWSSSDIEVVEIDEDTGELTVLGTSEDPVTITATSVLDPSQSDTITVYALEELLAVTGDYLDYSDDANVSTDINVAFPTITGAVGDPTFTLLSGALPVDFVTLTGLIDPEPLETYSVTLDADTGAISGQTGFPGVFTGTVQVEDSIGQTATASFSLELGVSLFYAGGAGDPPNVYTHVSGLPSGGEEIVVAGDLVQLSGVANTAFLPEGFLANFEFDLEYVTSVGPEVPGMFEINESQGAIVRVGGSADTSYHEYIVVLTYDDDEYDEEVEYEIRFRRVTDAPFPDEDPVP